jgi:UDP-3-O-[3-hydroxymyristoyl] glucosamine N-acyltransferase
VLASLLAKHLQLELVGDDREILAIAPIHIASSTELAFVSQLRFLSQLAATKAGVVIVRPDWLDQVPEHCTAILASDPYLAFARATRYFVVAESVTPGVHPSAMVHPEAIVDASASVGPNVSIGKGSEIGAEVVIGANVSIAEHCKVGAGCRLEAGAVLYSNVHIGRRSRLHSNAVIGSDGFGFAPSPEGWVKIEQLGGVRIGDDCDIGANTVIDRGALQHTVLGNNVIIDNLVQVAHNCVIGDHTAIAACVGLAGSTHIGKHCTLAGGVGVVGHLEICDNVHVTAMSMVTKSISEPGSYSSGTTMMPSTEWRKSAVRMGQLESLNKRVQQLEKLLSKQTRDQ